MQHVRKNRKCVQNFSGKLMGRDLLQGLGEASSTRTSQATSCSRQCYRGADNALARPGRKQARKHVRDARNFNNIEKRAVINFFFSCKARRRRKFTPLWQEYQPVSFLVGLRTYQHPCTFAAGTFKVTKRLLTLCIAKTKQDAEAALNTSCLSWRHALHSRHSVKCSKNSDSIGFVLNYSFDKFFLQYFYYTWRTEKYTGKIIRTITHSLFIALNFMLPHADQILPNLPAQNKRMNTGLV